MTRSAWLPWALWMVIACIVSTASSRPGEVAQPLRACPEMNTRRRSPDGPRRRSRRCRRRGRSRWWSRAAAARRTTARRGRLSSASQRSTSPFQRRTPNGPSRCAHGRRCPSRASSAPRASSDSACSRIRDAAATRSGRRAATRRSSDDAHERHVLGGAAQHLEDVRSGSSAWRAAPSALISGLTGSCGQLDDGRVGLALVSPHEVAQHGTRPDRRPARGRRPGSADCRAAAPRAAAPSSSARPSTTRRPRPRRA